MPRTCCLLRFTSIYFGRSVDSPVLAFHVRDLAVEPEDQDHRASAALAAASAAASRPGTSSLHACGPIVGHSKLVCAVDVRRRGAGGVPPSPGRVSPLSDNPNLNYGQESILQSDVQSVQSSSVNLT